MKVCGADIDVEQVFADLGIDFDPLVSIDDETGGARFIISDRGRTFDEARKQPGTFRTGVITY